MENVRRLILEGVHNVRDLGGYFTDNNGITKWGVFLRSADLYEITQNDRDALYQYGVRTIVNLKSSDETANPIEMDKRFHHIQVPLIDDFPKMFSIIKEYGGSFYLTMIEAFQNNIKQIIMTIAEHIDNGGTLFHCVSGKDRTGVITALILLINGVSELDVLADFALSAIYLRPDADKKNKPYEDILKYPQEIESVMQHLNNKYNGAENYLLTIGVPPADIKKIRSALQA